MKTTTTTTIIIALTATPLLRLGFPGAASEPRADDEAWPTKAMAGRQMHTTDDGREAVLREV